MFFYIVFLTLFIMYEIFTLSNEIFDFMQMRFFCLLFTCLFL